MTTLRFLTDTHSLDFSVGSSYPSGTKTEVIQATDRTSAGSLVVESFGPSINTHTLDFQLLPKADYANLLNWFQNVVNGSAVPFTFIDEYGVSRNVVFTGSALDFTEVFLNRFAGTVTLEVV